MTSKIDKTWHLAKNEQEVKVTEFEFQLWRVFHGFTRWQEDCQKYVFEETLSANELALLHIIRMNERPKTIYDLSRLLNRDDPNNIQYGITKLIKLNLIEKAKTERSKKAISYQVTEYGIKHTEVYCEARSSILIELFNKSDMDIESATKILQQMHALYDEASRIAASYKKSKD